MGGQGVIWLFTVYNTLLKTRNGIGAERLLEIM